MKITDMHWSPGTEIYTIVCDCNNSFACAVHLKRRIRCPRCGREANLYTLEREWRERASGEKDEKIQR